jgi:hypothetical protein
MAGLNEWRGNRAREYARVYRLPTPALSQEEGGTAERPSSKWREGGEAAIIHGVNRLNNWRGEEFFARLCAAASYGEFGSEEKNGGAE